MNSSQALSGLKVPIAVYLMGRAKVPKTNSGFSCIFRTLSLINSTRFSIL